MHTIALHDLLHMLQLRHSPAGAASQPIVLVDLDELESLSPREASLLAHRLPDDLRIYVGVRTRPLPVPLIGPGQQILERLTTTISPTVGALADGTPEGPASATSAVVRVDDPLETAARIAEQGRRTPDAVHVMDTVLRIAERATARETLISESYGYAALLDGPEYGAWRTVAGAPVGPPAQVRRDRHGDTNVVTIDWTTPESGMDHALRLAVAQALLDARHEGADEIELRAEGPDFCAQPIPDDDPARRGDARAHLNRLQRHPGVAAWLVHRRLTVRVQGRCCSAGLELAAFAHTVIADRDARFWVPHLPYGLCFGAGGSVSLTSRIGRWRTAYLALSGASIDAATALRWGLVDVIADAHAPSRPPYELVGAPSRA